jgi:hypothetical protein
MEPKGSLPYSQKHYTGTYPAPEESSIHHFTLVKLIFVINNLLFHDNFLFLYNMIFKKTDVLLLYVLVIYSNPSATQTNDHPKCDAKLLRTTLLRLVLGHLIGGKQDNGVGGMFHCFPCPIHWVSEKSASLPSSQVQIPLLWGKLSWP